MLEPTTVATAATQAPTLDGFARLAEEYCEQKGLGAGFQKEVRGFFLKSLARTYWDSLRRYMASTTWPVAKACKAAGLDPSTHTRWDQMVPTFETICLLFARCDLDMKGVGFPTGHEAFRSAFFKTVEHIRSKYLHNAPSRLDEDAFECLRQVLHSQAVLEALQVTEKPAARDAKEVMERINQAAEAIAAGMRTRLPKGRINDAATVQQAIADWLIPWVLFYTVIPSAQRGC
jgi:hypothetical protein